MAVGTFLGDVLTVTFTPHTYLSIQSKSRVKPPQLVLGSRLTRLLDNGEEKFSYGKITIPELTVTHQVLFKTGVKVKILLIKLYNFCF